jgi:hypothetical protein
MLRPERSREFRLAVRRAAEELSWQREAQVLAENYKMAAESAGLR